MKITVLGCGSSMGVPALKYGWGYCDKNNPKNRRTRSSIIIENENTTLLVDMSPDLRQQLLDYESNGESVSKTPDRIGENSVEIDAVILTHVHYDHSSGLNELRPLFLGKIDYYLSTQGKVSSTRLKKYFFICSEKANTKFINPTFLRVF